MNTTLPKVVTPDHITHLSACEVFVFGSNLAGHHHGGAARMAHECFGAEGESALDLRANVTPFPPCKEA